jgi:hypothetical protein
MRTGHHTQGPLEVVAVPEGAHCTALRGCCSLLGSPLQGLLLSLGVEFVGKARGAGCRAQYPLEVVASQFELLTGWWGYIRTYM